MTILVTIFIAIPSSLESEWNKRGSIYDVEDEFRNTMIAFKLREGLYKIGFDDSSYLGAYLKNWHKREMDEAFLLIPKNDGERALWQHRYQLEGILNYRNNNPEKISQITPELLQTFEKVTSFPISTKVEYKQGRFLTANRISTFFFKNWRKSSLPKTEKKYWLRHMVERMTTLEKEVDISYF